MDEGEVQAKRRGNEEMATEKRAQILGLPYLDTRPFELTAPLVVDFESILSRADMRRDFIVPLYRGQAEQAWEFGITSASPRSLIGKMTKEYQGRGDKIQFFLISDSAYRVLINRYDPPQEVHYDDIKIASEGDSETLAAVSETLNSVSSDRVFDYLIDQADGLGASDIHIENMREMIRVRMRVDGVLHPVANLSRDRYRVILGELSSRASLSTAASTPQSGHLQKEIVREGSRHVLNIRVESIPTLFGMDAVLRLFNFDESLLNINLLGISDGERSQLEEIISHPRGLVLMVGPTGSGKSTTLYSLINALNTTDRKIITLEDPVEYSITGISQVPVHTNDGGSFAEGLRSVLRLDPDVVMVGEIRDADTAKTAIQASITGHLVLSSFHANSASAAFARMIDMIGTNPIFATSIRLVVAQRLVRKLAPNKEEYEPDEATKDYVKMVLEGVAEAPDLTDLRLCRPVTSEEYPFGYSGRFCIMEQLVVDSQIQSYLSGEVENNTALQIEQTARKNGMLTLLQKGILAVVRGETTLEEVSRTV
jgi:type II secretory ATPase GspE/PulE/Tfp pilus assembly ATPase PilB-like protein